ncbi:alkaline phosphatase family protein [Serratia sp. DD3]|uniref:alkaline phosphatase family protein n=1 Tax=Serratia sp. DD3 TaxID=1410619 RepID=UPI0003C510F2|nr:alkaline phosphatase family protein [Serratia sp. DD3]KEY60909.1 type I phosphodiesterase / nucleotide pyrophosphatase [Serratia sp. DD3]
MKSSVLIIGFDGLRPDAVTPERMPNLYRLMQEWTVCRGHRAVFPTETYVNHPSIYTGANPSRHGIIANMYYNQPGTSVAPFFDGSSVSSIEQNDTQYPLFQARAMGQILGEANMTMRVIGSNSAGSTRLKHHTAEHYPGHLNLPVHDTASALPQEEKAFWQQRMGNGPALTKPDYAGSQAVVDAFFQVEVPRGLADVTVLWIGEPDHTCHGDGVDGNSTLAALAQADRLFGTLIEWWQQQGQQIQLAVISDHGHVTIARHSNLRGALTDAGLRIITPYDMVAGASPSDADFMMVGAYCGGLWAMQQNPAAINLALEALQGYEETGMLFCRETLGTSLPDGIFSENLVLSHHPRSPDIRFITKGDPERGTIAMEPCLPIGGGAHGGLLPQELQSLCLFAGSRFKSCWENTLPSGPADIAATVLSILGFGQEILDGLDGRVLSECFNNESQNPGLQVVKETLFAQKGRYQQVLERTRYNGKIYLDKGFRE